jgi:hypothetical protein
LISGFDTLNTNSMLLSLHPLNFWWIAIGTIRYNSMRSLQGSPLSLKILMRYCYLCIQVADAYPCTSTYHSVLGWLCVNLSLSLEG